MSDLDDVYRDLSGKVLPEFRVIRDGVKVHSTLKDEDLRLIRRAFSSVQTFSSWYNMNKS